MEKRYKAYRVDLHKVEFMESDNKEDCEKFVVGADIFGIWDWEKKIPLTTSQKEKDD